MAKKAKRISFLLSERSWSEFDELCKSLDADYSTILRSLIEEACQYSSRMKLEKWSTPKMVPDIPRAIIPDGWERQLNDDGSVKLIPNPLQKSKK